MSLLLYFKLEYALYSLNTSFNYRGKRTQGEYVVLLPNTGLDSKV
jgi:hypothetical protein